MTTTANMHAQDVRAGARVKIPECLEGTDGAGTFETVTSSERSHWAGSDASPWWRLTFANGAAFECAGAHGVTVDGTAPQQIAQLGELFDLLNAGGITGAQLVMESPELGRRQVTAARYEGTLEHPMGRLILTVSDCVHYSDPVNGCAAGWDR